MTPDLALQKALRQRLIGTAAITDLVPATHILDTNQRPAPMPSIIIGEDQVLEGNRYDRRDVEIISTLHCFAKEPGLTTVKTIAGAVRAAVHNSRLTLDSGFVSADLHVSGARYLRDPDGVHGHAVLTVEAMVLEVSQ